MEARPGANMLESLERAPRNVCTGGKIETSGHSKGKISRRGSGKVFAVKALSKKVEGQRSIAESTAERQREKGTCCVQRQACTKSSNQAISKYSCTHLLGAGTLW